MSGAPRLWDEETQGLEGPGEGAPHVLSEALLIFTTSPQLQGPFQPQSLHKAVILLLTVRSPQTGFLPGGSSREVARSVKPSQKTVGAVAAFSTQAWPLGEHFKGGTTY